MASTSCIINTSSRGGTVVDIHVSSSVADILFQVNYWMSWHIYTSKYTQYLINTNFRKSIWFDSYLQIFTVKVAPKNKGLLHHRNTLQYVQHTITCIAIQEPKKSKPRSSGPRSMCVQSALLNLEAQDLTGNWDRGHHVYPHDPCQSNQVSDLAPKWCIHPIR